MADKPTCGANRVSRLVMITGALLLLCGCAVPPQQARSSSQSPEVQAAQCVAASGSDCFANLDDDDLANEMDQLCNADSSSTGCLQAFETLSDRTSSAFDEKEAWRKRCVDQAAAPCKKRYPIPHSHPSAARAARSFEQWSTRFEACLEASCQTPPQQHSIDLFFRARKRRMQASIAILSACVGQATPQCKTLAAKWQDFSILTPQEYASADSLAHQVSDLADQVLAQPTYEPPAPQIVEAPMIEPATPSYPIMIPAQTRAPIYLPPPPPPRSTALTVMPNSGYLSVPPPPVPSPRYQPPPAAPMPAQVRCNGQWVAGSWYSSCY